jgi:NTE family protein
MKKSEKKVGLVLGGGGARGFAHIGVLKVLEEHKIPIDIIIGTSMGAFIGGAYATGIAANKLEKMVIDFEKSKTFKSSRIKKFENESARAKGGGPIRRTINLIKTGLIGIESMLKSGILTKKEFEPIINYFIPDILIQNTKIPFRAITTDLSLGEQITISAGSLRHAVMASCSVPGVIEPVQNGSQLLSDGGITSLVPVQAAKKEGANIILAVDVEKDIKKGSEIRTASDIYSRASDITSHCLVDYELKEAHVVIRPNVGNLLWYDFSHARELIYEGEKAAKECLENIKNAIAFKKPSILKSFFRALGKALTG